MSGASEASAAVMSGREPFTLTPTISPPHQHPLSSQSQLDLQMRVPYAAEGTYRPVGPSPPFQPGGGGASANQVMNSNSGDQKRKRGRPRKYGADGSMAMAMPQPVSVGMPPMENFSPPPTEAQPLVGGSASPSTKKRGRPPGSSNKKKQIEAIGSTGIGFIPHVINVKPGGTSSSPSRNFMGSAPTPKMNTGGGGGGGGTSSSPSRGTFSESSGGPASPLSNNHHPLHIPSVLPWK